MTADIDRFRNNLRDEMNGVALYTALAVASAAMTSVTLGQRAEIAR